MAASELIAAGLADCLCSDYVPSTILPAVFKIARDQDKPLNEAASLATKNPAAAAQLYDRGIIAEGKRADLIAVEWLRHQPLVTRTWSAGRQAFFCERNEASSFAKSEEKVGRR